jgi:RNA polymerase sigma-54 factor
MNGDNDSQNEANPTSSPESKEHPENWGADHEGAYWQRGKVLQATRRQLRNLLAVIIAKNPAVRFTAETAPDKPELAVRKQGGKWKVTANPDAKLNVEAVDAGTSEQRRLARWWARVIQQREETMVRVAEELLVERQKQFLAQGQAEVAPCNMSEVGKGLGVHQTTVSRAVMGKSIETPHGVFELRYFFTPAIQTVTGEPTSAQAVREHLKELLKSTDTPCHWTSDQLRKLLEDRYGVIVARRTVAKYREQLAVLAAQARKPSISSPGIG